MTKEESQSVLGSFKILTSRRIEVKSVGDGYNILLFSEDGMVLPIYLDKDDKDKQEVKEKLVERAEYALKQAESFKDLGGDWSDIEKQQGNNMAETAKKKSIYISDYIKKHE